MWLLFRVEPLRNIWFRGLVMAGYSDVFDFEDSSANRLTSFFTVLCNCYRLLMLLSDLFNGIVHCINLKPRKKTYFPPFSS